MVLNQSLVSGRFVQLTPPYTGGPALHDGSVIPIDRTAVPVEWNEVEAQLLEVSERLAPGLDDDREMGGDIAAVTRLVRAGDLAGLVSGG